MLCKLQRSHLLERAVAANFFFLTNPTLLMVEKALAVVYNFYWSSRLLKLILTLLKVKKDISKVTSMLMFANKNVFFKKWDFPSLFFTRNKAIIIP